MLLLTCFGLYIDEGLLRVFSTLNIGIFHPIITIHIFQFSSEWAQLHIYYLDFFITFETLLVFLEIILFSLPLYCPLGEP